MSGNRATQAAPTSVTRPAVQKRRLSLFVSFGLFLKLDLSGNIGEIVEKFSEGTFPGFKALLSPLKVLGRGVQDCLPAFKLPFDLIESLYRLRLLRHPRFRFYLRSCAQKPVCRANEIPPHPSQLPRELHPALV